MVIMMMITMYETIILMLHQFYFPAVVVG